MKIESNSPALEATIRNASKALKASIENIPELSDEQKRVIENVIENTSVPAAEVPNTFVYWLAVGAMAGVATLIVIGGLLLAMFNHDIPIFLQTVLATAVGALAGMVVPSPRV